MVLLMVDGTERDGELVADLEPKSPRLCEAEVMGVARRSPANEGAAGPHLPQLRSTAAFAFDREHRGQRGGLASTMTCQPSARYTIKASGAGTFALRDFVDRLAKRFGSKVEIVDLLEVHPEIGT
jgi:hypothetical protein